MMIMKVVTWKEVASDISGGRDDDLKWLTVLRNDEIVLLPVCNSINRGTEIL